MMTWDVAITRWICAILLHLSLMPELKQAITMFKYWINHSNNFKLEKPERSQALKTGVMPPKKVEAGTENKQKETNTSAISNDLN